MQRAERPVFQAGPNGCECTARMLREGPAATLALHGRDEWSHSSAVTATQSVSITRRRTEASAPCHSTNPTHAVASDRHPTPAGAVAHPHHTHVHPILDRAGRVSLQSSARRMQSHAVACASGVVGPLRAVAASHWTDCPIANRSRVSLCGLCSATVLGPAHS